MPTPIYVAELQKYHFRAVTAWKDPYTYARPITMLRVDLPEHFRTDGPALSHSETKNMIPVMEQMYGIENRGYLNSGEHANPLYTTPQEYAQDALAYFPSSTWTYARLMQYHIPKWEQSIQYHKDFIEALEARSIEDAWITNATYIKEGDFADDIGIGMYSLATHIRYSPAYKAAPFETVSGQASIKHHITPCNLELSIPCYSRSYSLTRTVEGVIAFGGETPPTVEVVATEPCDPTDIIANAPAMGTSSSYVGQPIIVNGNPAVFRVIQPDIWEDRLVDLAAAEAYAHAVAPEKPGYAIRYTGVFSEDVEIPQGFFSYSATDSHNGSNIYRASNFPSQVDAMNAQSTGIVLINRVWKFRWMFDPDGTMPDGSPLGSDPVSITTTVHSVFFMERRPRAWKHDDPEFEGYVPYLPGLLNNESFLLDYIRNPDDRFDGFYFMRKVSVAQVTRAWQVFVRNVPNPLNTTEELAFHKASLLLSHFVDNETNEIIPSFPDYCNGITGVEFSGLSSDMMEPIESDPVYWEEYEWPNLPITIPGGTFLLESGSNAPIYPDFHGAFIYDTHLKKWGRMDLEHKAVFDYMSVNTYKPGEQSFSRFGIFGGVLQADGKIYLFDDEPADSFITYGKVGYYRQGMTSPEEVRVHMRFPSDFTVRVKSSIEGKLIEPTFTTSTDFVQTSRGIHYGGYAAKWHNITISGKYDITYLEFRGITTGKR